MIERIDDRLRVTAPMVIANARALLDAGRGLLAADFPTGQAARLDLAGVGEVDSSALAVVLAWLRTAAAKNLPLRLVEPPANLLSLARLYGVDELLPPA
ncbi:MAG TPA: STAS domain-containing protein [Accumulibacter sp.]|nr:STAS domain-containing protein [Accumulibacter sp.]HMW16748.1 STAS domain-containing protein [Accumulibacter sp.]HMX23678.1 STAS domain-containing protein [Accumulibacter sp.]HMY07691.1 STAS domain-containing protein [Accumulibacter sp.]HNC18237.1 STAS domain-containing protein [Accumulibacter sp.]